MATGSFSLKALDYGNEATRFGGKLIALTAANFDAQIALVDALQTAANNVVLGTFNGKQVNAVDVPVGVKASDEYAQREAKWRVTFTDDTDPIGNSSFEIPMPDLTLLVAGEGKMDVSGGAGAALVTAIENAVVSRLGNAITVVSIVHVGRNL